MDDNGNHENGRHKPPQAQWLMHHHPSMKQIMSLMSERDAAIQERNLAVSEKKSALAERDMAISLRDSAITERNNAIMERDNAIATLQNAMNNSYIIARGEKYEHHPQHHVQHPQQQVHQTSTLSPVPPEPAKTHRTKRVKDAKKTSKSSKKVKQEVEEWNNGPDLGSDEFNGQVSKPDWKDRDLGLNQIRFDDSTMPVPVCSCTGVLRPCYKWDSGGWQSSCCTNNLSMFPLPVVPNKRHTRVGGRKMSGGAFSKLISRLAAEGYDLSNPVDLKDNWAKHGTNRYITIK